MSVSCSLVVTYGEKADLLALLYVMFSHVFVTFIYSALGRMWYLIVSIPYFYNSDHESNMIYVVFFFFFF